MKEYVIRFLILLFGISFNNGHTLSRIELNETDIYEVKEGQSTLTITHPKDGKPTLREIVYFHVIEKPYDNDGQVSNTPDIDKRSFTNGHGFQYFEEHDDVIDNTGTEDETVTEKDEYYDGDENETEDITESTDTTDDDESGNDGDEERDNDEKDKEIGNRNDTDDAMNTDDVELKNGANDTVGTINDDEDPIDIDDIKKPENIDARFGDVDISTVNIEPGATQDLPESRRKREIDYKKLSYYNMNKKPQNTKESVKLSKNLPAAPELPEFKLDILPDYIKAIIFADQDADENTNGSDNIEDEIEKQVRLLERAANHPPSVERENDSKKRDARTFDNSLEDRKGDIEDTYGMSLTGNVGKVWNNLDGHHLHYINDPETLTSTISKLEAKDTTTEAFVDDHTESHQDNHDINKLKDLDELKNFGDSLDEINNLLEELLKNNTSEEKTIVTTETFRGFSDNKEDLLDVDYPLTEEDNHSKGRDSVYENGPADDKKDQKREARTYGMSLEGNRGEVWNDVNTHLAYHVGETDTISTLIPDVTDSTTVSTTASIETSTDNGDSKEPKEVTDEEQLKDIGDSLDEINKLLEELLNMTNEAKTPTTDKSSDGDDNGDSKNVENDKDSDHLKDIEDSFDEVNKLLNELIKNSTSETTTENNNKPNVNDSTTMVTTEATITESDSTVATSTEPTTAKVTEKSTDLDETTDKNTKIPNNKIDGKNNDRKHNNGTHDNEESKQKQFVKELMKNKFFWQWLQDSSTAYLEVLMKKVDDLIKAEVDKQLKQYFEEHKNETRCKPDNKESQNNSTEKPIQNNNATDIDTVTERPTANNTLEKPVETNTIDVTETSTQNPVVTTEPSAINNTIDKTDNNNKTEDDLARKQNKDSNDKKETVKIEANNVYGNSVGNGKVTNIFIFNISKESDLAKIKPLNNGTNGVFVFGLDDKTGKEKDKKTNEGDKPDTSKDYTDKPEINTVTTAKPEVVTDPTSEEPIDKINASTTKNVVIDKQTTTEPSEITTTSSHVDNEPGNTEKNIETTTEKIIELTTEKLIDSTTDKIIEITTEANKELTTEAAKESSTENKDIETNTKPEQEKANDNTTESSTSSPNDEGDEKTEEPSTKESDSASTTESTKSNEDNVEDITNVTKKDQTKEAEPKEESTTESTKVSEVTTDKTDKVIE